MSNTRTGKSLKNSTIATIFYLFNLGLQFFSRKIFLEYLGPEILGLNTTAMNLLQFLNLAELGISAAVGFTLYKPILDNDTSTINEIVTLQGQIYRRIALIILGGALILMLVFPLIFKKIELPIWYAYASFSVLLYSALLGYFINYKQIVLSANQQDYKVQYSYKSVMIIKVGIQMLAVYYFENGYVWWLIIEALFATIGSVSLHRMTMRTFPHLSSLNIPFNILKKKYPEFTTKIKQLFFHKIGGFALTQSSPLIIYAYTTLSVVAVYGNYLIITTGLTALLAAVFNGINASIGNLIAEGNPQKIEKVFVELFSLRFLIVTTICFVTFITAQNFIELWIGSEYLLPESTLLLITISLYISLSRYSVDQFINGYGLFQDIYAPIVEAILNITLSIILGAIWGLNGILGGVIVSQIIIVKLWKPYFLCKYGLKNFFSKYILLTLKHLLCGFICILICCLVNPNLSHNYTSFTGWGFHILTISIIFFGILTILLVITKSGLQYLFIRLFARKKS